jgi:hypothetical protein
MKIFKLSLALLLVTALSACGYNEGVRSTEHSSFVYFTGNAKGAFAKVGDGESFIVNKLGERNVYKVASGKQRVLVSKAGVVLVDRLVLLGDGQSKEFNVPE